MTMKLRAENEPVLGIPLKETIGVVYLGDSLIAC